MPWKIAPWCTDCGNCELVCPVNAVVRDASASRFRILDDHCDACSGQPEIVCQRNCPSEAIIFVKPRKAALHLS